MNYERTDARGRRNIGGIGGGKSAKKFSPPRPSGREGLMFPPEQFIKLGKVIVQKIGGRNTFL